MAESTIAGAIVSLAMIALMIVIIIPAFAQVIGPSPIFSITIIALILAAITVVISLLRGS